MRACARLVGGSSGVPFRPLQLDSNGGSLAPVGCAALPFSVCCAISTGIHCRVGRYPAYQSLPAKWRIAHKRNSRAPLPNPVLPS